jgi:hypothetical protein
MAIARVAEFGDFQAEYAPALKWVPSANVSIGGCESLQRLARLDTCADQLVSGSSNRTRY